MGAGSEVKSARGVINIGGHEFKQSIHVSSALDFLCK